MVTLGDVTDLVESGLDHAVEAGEQAAKNLAHEAWDTIACSSVVQTIKSDASAIASGFSSLLQTAEKGLSRLAGQAAAYELSGIVNTMDALSAAATNPGQGNIQLVPDGKDQWSTTDRKVVVQKVDSFAATDSGVSAYFAHYDEQMNANKQGAAHLDFGTDDIYRSNVSSRRDIATAGERQYTNGRGERAVVSLRNGKLVYEARSRKRRTIKRAERDQNRAQLRVGDETAVLDIKGHKLTVDSPQVKVLQDNKHAEITLSDKRKILRKNGKLTLLDADGKEIGSVDENELKINGVSVFETSAKMNASDARPGDQIKLQVNAEGESRLILPNGVIIAVRKDHTALIKGTQGEVLLLDQNGKLWQWENGKFVQITNGHHGSTHSSGDGYRFGNLQIGRDGTISGDDLSIDLKGANIIRTKGGTETTRVHLADATQPTTITGPSGTDKIEAHEVTHTDKQGRQAKFSLGPKPQIEAGPVVAKLDEIRLRKDENPAHDTVILPDNQVRFEGSSPAVLYGDGSMKLDEEVSVSAQGYVTFGRDYYAYGEQPGSGAAVYGNSAIPAGASVAAVLMPAVESVAAGAESAAAEVFARAAQGKVTQADISRLESSKGDIAALVSLLSAAGLSDQAASLTALMGSLDRATAAAVPKLTSGTITA